MPDSSLNGVVAIPKWFLAAGSFVLLAAIPWAGQQSINTAVISNEMKSMKVEVIRRIDRNETRIDKLHELHRSGGPE